MFVRNLYLDLIRLCSRAVVIEQEIFRLGPHSRLCRVSCVQLSLEDQKQEARKLHAFGASTDIISSSLKASKVDG